MTIAKARYTGSMRTHTRRGPSGRTYSFHTSPDTDGWVDIDEPEDARHLAEQSVIEVEWSTLGRLKAQSGDAMEAITEMGYSAKQKLVGDDGFDLDVAGNASEDDLEAALQDHVRELTEEGDL